MKNNHPPSSLFTGSTYSLDSLIPKIHICAKFESMAGHIYWVQAGCFVGVDIKPLHIKLYKYLVVHMEVSNIGQIGT
jgi:hypothetical protein